MAFFTIPNVRIKGISACVPPTVEENIDIPFYSADEAQKVINATGVKRKRIVSKGITASDLCQRACEKLLEDLGWERDSLDAICFVTQTPDYLSQPTGFIVHDRMNLSAHCLVLDLYHGCPGWVVGLNTLSSLVSHGTIKRAILLDGDNVTLNRYALDHESFPLFGDCGTATALEYDETAPNLLFDHGTNSKDGGALIHKNGGSRNPYTRESFDIELRLRAGELSTEGVDDIMDGMSVFSFGISAPPKSIKRLCDYFQLDLGEIDKVVLHQANLFMLQKIIKKLKVDPHKVPMSLNDYGNTTSASIPLTIVSQCQCDYTSLAQKTIACGFGTGLAWASVYFETDSIIIPDVLTY